METSIYKNRRLKLGSTYNQTLFVISSGKVAKRSHSVHYRFKVNSDFFYLTGLTQPDLTLVVVGAKSYLLSPKVDQLAVIWGDQEAQYSATQLAQLEGTELVESDQLQTIVRSHSTAVQRIATVLGMVSEVDSILMNEVTYGRGHKNRSDTLALVDSRSLVGFLRLTKEQSEIEKLKIAGQKSSWVHTELMKQAMVGKTERQISNWIEAQFLLQDMQWASYETIVGAGDRSVALHARASDNMIKENQIVLVDAGAEYQGYCADITRTFPSGNKFSAEQKDIYQAVLHSQMQTLKSIRTGTTLRDLHKIAQESLVEQLQRLNINIESADKKILELMPHSTSHWIGLDVHDPASYVDDKGEALRLQTGMTFTVEPGLYFRKNILGTASKYDGIGVRIEDDVVVTDSGCELLTNVVKDVGAIEDLRSSVVR